MSGRGAIFFRGAETPPPPPRALRPPLPAGGGRLPAPDRPQCARPGRRLARDFGGRKAARGGVFAAVAARIENLMGGVDSLPLALEERRERTPPPKEPAGSPERGFLARLGAEVWSELSQLVVVRRMGATEPPLLPPTQAYFCRGNLRLRLRNARASLLAPAEAGYREDLRASTAWVQRYFDPRSKLTADATAQLKGLARASISFEMPTISESLDAVRGYKSRRERTPG